MDVAARLPGERNGSLLVNALMRAGGIVVGRVFLEHTAQASVDMDASRLVLLDRAENGDHGADDGDSNIPF